MQFFDIKQVFFDVFYVFILKTSSLRLISVYIYNIVSLYHLFQQIIRTPGECSVSL